MLLSIIDTIGGNFRGNEDIDIVIDGKNRKIKNTSQHFFILNSKYFNLGLSELDIKNIYENVRSTLVHNSLMPSGYQLSIGEREISPFKIGIKGEERIYIINIKPLYRMAKNALLLFFMDIKNKKIDLEKSDVFKNVSKRDSEIPIYFNSITSEYFKNIDNWIVE